ncbi:MAG: hypothetical protein COS89_01050 [Deltaproteobacteria bacterium CG07_land_8_20_14_0_80_38_7]|nr:MAG: hypothetical protein COS89_01050 [Deltaproteobacteria bacterium CG07_land_8_20_14_0_80_38_7]
MSMKKKTWCFYLILAGFAMTINGVHAQESQDKSMTESEDVDKVKIVNQIPEGILLDMSTEELIQAYIESRFTGLILAYDNPQDGFNRVYEDFSGLRELLNRDDIGIKLVTYYQGMDPGLYDPNWEPSRIGKFTFKFIFIEVLIAQERILERLTHSEVKLLLSELLKKNELKTRYCEKHSILGLSINAFAITRLIELKGKQSGFSLEFLQEPGMDYLLKTGRLRNDRILPALIQKAQEFLQSY